MEKLQAALDKARNRREAGAEDAPTLSRKPARKRRSSGKSALWSDLKEIRPTTSELQDHLVVTRQACEKATPFDILRTKILLQMRQNNWKSIAITSPMPQSGKTTMACNLALGLGRQGELNTMLFDLDLQSPSVHSFLGHTPEHNITDMLSGQVPFEEQAVRIGQSVAVSMANRSDPDPSQTLLSDQTTQKLHDIQAAYDPDIMIFDMPSILTGDNTRAFLRNVDCALIVTRANNTKYGHFDACEREIAEYTNVIGVVLNAFRSKSIEHSIET